MCVCSISRVRDEVLAEGGGAFQVQQEPALTFCLSVFRQLTEVFQVAPLLALKWTAEQLPWSHQLSDNHSEAVRQSPSSLGDNWL